MNESAKNNVCVKEQILLELGQAKEPLNIQELHERVEKSRRGISYHAVHKSAKNLLKGGVLERQGKSYTISRDWILRVCEQLEGIRHNYLYNKPIRLPGMKEFKEEADTKTFVFDTLEEADNYRKQLQWEYLIAEGEKQPYCALSWHLRSPLFSSERALNIMNMATQTRSEAYIIVAGDSPIDHWCADYYRSQFVRVQTGAPIAHECDTMVLGDTVVQIYLPLAAKQYIESVYSSANGVSDINIPDFYRRVYRESHDVKLVVIRNAEIARQLRSQIMKHFDFKKVAIFDVNETLVDGFLVTLFAEYLALNSKFNKDAWNEILLLQKSNKKGEISGDKYVSNVIDLYANGVKGQSVDEIKQMAKKFVEEGRVPLFRPSRVVFNWVNSYYRTITITKTTEEIMEAALGVFPFDEIITSHLEVKDGKYTGKIKSRLDSKEEKIAAFRSWLKSAKLSLEGSLAFGNSWHDISFMEHAEIPVLLGDADPKGMAVAKKRGWLIFDRNTNPSEIIDALKGKIAKR